MPVSYTHLDVYKRQVLIDHMMNSHPCANADYFRRFVRNPRLSNEMITPYKGFFEKVVPEQEREAYLADPMNLAAWVAENIRVHKDCNLGGSPITPEGVWTVSYTHLDVYKRQPRYHCGSCRSLHGSRHSSLQDR